MRAIATTIVCAGALALGLACGGRDQPPQFATIEDDCANKCMLVIYVCEEASQSQPEYEACVEECLGFKDESLEQGAVCAHSFETMMQCVGELDTCDAVYAWALREPDGECIAESADFDRRCEDF